MQKKLDNVKLLPHTLFHWPGILANHWRTDMTDSITIGTRVRSFDFANGPFGRDLTGERANFITGTVVAIGDFLGQGFDQYQIRPDNRMISGHNASDKMAEHYYPPVNGTPSWMFDEDGTQFVEQI